MSGWEQIPPRNDADRPNAAAAKQSTFGIIAGQEFDCAEPIISSCQFPEFVAETRDMRDCHSAWIRRLSRLHRTTDYATVLLPLPGISNDLEVARLL